MTAPWGSNVYRVICHGCGIVHEVEAGFLSVPHYIERENGETFPTYGCEKCRAEPGKIRRAWEALTGDRRAWEQFKADNWEVQS